MTNLDRFAQGPKDTQEALPIAECAGCGGDIYPDDEVFELRDGAIVHAETECIRTYCEPQKHIAKEVLPC